MAYGTANVDVIQSSTANTPVQFNDGNGTQIGTLCRAWVNFNGTSGASPVVRASFNVSSVTRNGTGDYTVNFTNALSDANYAPTLACRNDFSGTTAEMNICVKYGTTPSTSSFTVATTRFNSGNIDTAYAFASVFR